MDPMRDALKKKRSTGLLGGGEQAPMGQEAAPEGSGQGMEALIQALSPEQKQELMQMLASDIQAGAKSGDISNGAPSSEEQAIIAEKAQGEPDPETDEYLSEGHREIDEPRTLSQRAVKGAQDRLKKRGPA